MQGRYYTDQNLSSSGVNALMPVRKIPPHKTLVRNLIASKKLTPAEQTAFEKLAAKFGLLGADPNCSVRLDAQAYELNAHEKLWVETLNAKYLKKS